MPGVAHDLWMPCWPTTGQTPLIAIVDSGPLLATVNAADPDHAACVEILTQREFTRIIPALCVAEVCYFRGQRHGPEVEARFVSALADFHVMGPEPEDWVRIGELVRRHGDLPLDATDASVAVLAERMSTTRIVTLDRRRFTVLRSTRGRPFDL